MTNQPIPSFDPAFNMPITRDVSQVLAEHYQFKCLLSGRSVANGGFHVDHIFPRARGGPDNLQNYVIADASANIGKNAQRLPPEFEQRLLQLAADSAPLLLSALLDQRGKDRRAINPMALFALRQLGLTLGTRVATGAYLRSVEGPAAGVRWWAYWGPDKSNMVTYDILQFGVKLTGTGVYHADLVRKAKGVRERGGNTFYIHIPASLPRTIDLNALRDAKTKFERIFDASEGGL
jgi:hypothetical protein